MSPTLQTPGPHTTRSFLLVALIGVAALANGLDPGTKDELPDPLASTLETYRTGYIDPHTLISAARTGSTTSLVFEDLTFNLTLWPHNLRACQVQAPPPNSSGNHSTTNASQPRTDCGSISGIVHENGTFEPVELGPPRTYRGTLLHENGTTNASTWIAFNIDEDGVDGVIGDREGAWFVQPLDERNEEGEIRHVRASNDVSLRTEPFGRRPLTHPVVA